MSTWADFFNTKEVDECLPQGLPLNSLPSAVNQYRAFSTTPFEDIRCVILGQDPYHTPGLANGLAFSVVFGSPIPPSLRNIFKEYQDDLGYSLPRSGDLSAWAHSGVFLLNTALTVEPGRPGVHTHLWASFTNKVIKKLSDEHSNLVFILWGRHAQSFAPLISVRGAAGHCILRAPHPSPFSANTGFFGSKPFSKTNEYLRSKGKREINWRL